MSDAPTTTTFTSRGRLAGLVRDEVPAGAGPNRANRTERRDAARPAVDEALYYRARLILGEGLARPDR
jgi:hypothetical protein